MLPGYFAPYAALSIAAGLVPLLWLAFFLIGVVTFGLNVDVGTGQSCFPSRLFRLPVRTGALAGWFLPMRGWRRVCCGSPRPRSSCGPG